MQNENQCAYQEVKFDPSKIVDIDEKIVSYERTRKGGDPNYVLPTDPSQDTIPECPESAKWHFAMVPIDQLVVCSNAQRARDEVMANTVLKNMERDWDWQKLTPLSATLYSDAKTGQKMYIVHEGQGRIMHAKRHPRLSVLPVLYRVSDRFQDVVMDFLHGHNKKLQSPITNIDDFRVRYEQGQPDVMELVQCMRDNGLELTFKSIDKNNDSRGLFDKNDVHELMFRTGQKTDRMVFAPITIRRWKKYIEYYSIIRRSMNGGYRYEDWGAIFTKIHNVIDDMRGNNANIPVSFHNLMTDAGRSIKVNSALLQDKLFSKRSVWNMYKRAMEILIRLKRNGYISDEWCQDMGNGVTYIDEMISRLNLQSEAASSKK